MFRKSNLLFLSIFCSSVLFSQSVNITAANPSKFDRKSETITINLSGVLQSYPALKDKTLGVFLASNELVNQLVDENSDGVPDILIFQSDFKSLEKKTFVLKAVSKNKGTISVVDGRFILPRQDYAWENDRIAFRVYGSALAGDVKNGIDVWTKRVRYPIVDKWYKGEEKTPKISYHEDHGEGADYFSVGKSLGCGSAGVMWKGKLVQAGLFSYYKVIANGPIRISFELYYPEWKLDTLRYIEIKRITLDAGSSLNKIEENFISNFPVNELSIASGLVKRKETQVTKKPEKGWMSLWGAATADASVGFLGTAVVLQNPVNCAAKEDETNWLLTSSMKGNLSYTYYSGAGWTKSGDFNSENDWNDYIDKFAELLKHPLTVSIRKK